MKLLNIWCKVVQAPSLSPSGKEHLTGGSEPNPSAPGCALSSLAQGWGLGLEAGTFSFAFSGPHQGRQDWGLAPQPGARREVHPAEASLPLAGVLIWCHSGEGEHTEVWLATGFWFGFVGHFFCFWFWFVFHLWFLWGSWFLLRLFLVSFCWLVSFIFFLSFFLPFVLFCFFG